MATWGLGGGETARASGRTLLFECRGPWVETQDQALLGARTSGAPQRRGSGRKCVLCPGAGFLVSGWERLCGEDKSLLGPGLGFHQSCWVFGGTSPAVCWRWVAQRAGAPRWGRQKQWGVPVTAMMGAVTRMSEVVEQNRGSLCRIQETWRILFLTRA